MTKQEFDKKYAGRKIAVQCKTSEDMSEFLSQADSFGYKWYGRDNKIYVNNSCWEVYRDKTCYNLNDGLYGDVAYYAIENYEIVQYQKENKMTKLRDGYYKIKTWKMMDEEYGSISDTSLSTYNQFTAKMEHNIPVGRVIKVEDGMWLTFTIDQSMILHEYFELGDTVYTKDDDDAKWIKSEYAGCTPGKKYPFSAIHHRNKYINTYRYCISEQEYNEKYTVPKMTAIYGMNKNTGLKSDRVRIAEELGITMDHVYEPKLVDERILDRFDPMWFIVSPDQRENIFNLDQSSEKKNCPYCGKNLDKVKIIDVVEVDYFDRKER